MRRLPTVESQMISNLESRQRQAEGQTHQSRLGRYEGLPVLEWIIDFPEGHPQVKSKLPDGDNSKRQGFVDPIGS
jgi:hypothetical protein